MPTGVLVLFYYALGCAIGFFIFWIYQLAVSFVFKSKFTRALDQYLLFSSCDVEASSTMQSLIQLAPKAELLEAGYKQLITGKIASDEFEQLIKQMKFTPEEFDKMLSLDNNYILLSDEMIAYLQAKHFRKLIEQ